MAGGPNESLMYVCVYIYIYIYIICVVIICLIANNSYCYLIIIIIIIHAVVRAADTRGASREALLACLAFTASELPNTPKSGRQEPTRNAKGMPKRLYGALAGVKCLARALAIGHFVAWHWAAGWRASQFANIVHLCK